MECHFDWISCDFSCDFCYKIQMCHLECVWELSYEKNWSWTVGNAS